MGAESALWYNKYCLTGFTDEQGYAWHRDESLQYAHGLEDNAYPGAIPVDDVLRRLFDWEALPGDVSITIPNPADPTTTLTIDDPYSLSVIHSKTLDILGRHTASYQIHQFDRWLLDNSATIMGSDLNDVGIANALLLKRGAVAAVQYQLPENIVLHDSISIRPTLLACTSHGGQLTSQYRKTIINTVCDNTMSAAIRFGTVGQVVSIKHSKHSALRETEAQEALGMLFTIGKEFEAEVNALLPVKVSGKDFVRYLDIVAPTEPNDKGNNPVTGKPWTNKAMIVNDNVRSELTQLWLSDDRVAPWRGTAYGIWQLNNTYDQHIASTNGDTIRGERNMLNFATGSTQKSDYAALTTLFDKVLKVPMPV